MEPSNFKFKLVKYDSSDKLARCFKVDFYTIKKNDLESISSRLKKIEDTVDKLTTDSNLCLEERNNSDNHGKAAVNLRYSKILDYEDYPKQLMRFYFVYQYHYSSLPFFSINDYYKCMNHFHDKLPPYLTCAILSKSSLNSPCSQLYMKNLDYCEYYYEQSVKYLSMSMGKNEMNIYMLHTLLILQWIDVNLNRQHIGISWIFTCARLVQAMELDVGDLDYNANKANFSNFSLTRLLKIIDYNNNEISKIFNLPKIVIFKKSLYDHEDKKVKEKDSEFIDRSFSFLPKEYYLYFKANDYYLNLKLLYIQSLERDLYNKSTSSNYLDCFNLIQYININYCKLPITIKYSKDCFSSEKICKYPMLKHSLSLYILVLKQSSLIYELLVRIINKSTINQIVFLTQNIISFNEKILNLLKDQQFCIFKSSKNIIRFRFQSFFYFGKLLLDLIENLNQEISIRKSSRLARCIDLAVAEFKSFSNYISNLQNFWDGSENFLKSLTDRYEAIKLINKVH
jgi:hypothetical protein